LVNHPAENAGVCTAVLTGDPFCKESSDGSPVGRLTSVNDLADIAEFFASDPRRVCFPSALAGEIEVKILI